MGTTERAGRKEWIALGVLALPLLLVSMDVSVLYFAVPFISADLGVSATEQLWIFDIYGFVLAGLLITMGSLGDRIGRRRLLLFGAVGFGLASVAAAYAQSPEQLIAARALLGIGGATLMPSTLALIRNMFHDPAQRSKAIAFWSAVMLGGITLGPVLGGFLLEHFWWGSVFLINTPAMVLLLVLAPVLLPEFRTPNAGRFDLIGSVLSLAAVLPVIWGIKELAANGVSTLPVVAIVAGLLFGVLFVQRQRTAAYPMLDLSMFRNRAFSGSLAANTIGTLALVGNAVFLTQYLQLVHGLSPLKAALWSLAPSILVGGAAPLATVLAGKLDRAYVIGGAFILAASGYGVLTQLHAESSLAVPLTGAGLLAAGLVMVMTLVTEAVVGSVVARTRRVGLRGDGNLRRIRRRLGHRGPRLHRYGGLSLGPPGRRRGPGPRRPPRRHRRGRPPPRRGGRHHPHHRPPRLHPQHERRLRRRLRTPPDHRRRRHPHPPRHHPAAPGPDSRSHLHRRPHPNHRTPTNLLTSHPPAGPSTTNWGPRTRTGGLGHGTTCPRPPEPVPGPCRCPRSPAGVSVVSAVVGGECLHPAAA